MSWEEEHERSVAELPQEIRDAHDRSSNHRADVEASLLCGCFFCCATFSPGEIHEWTDDDDSGVGQTAICPRCGIDSVIGDRSGVPLTPEFLAMMQRHWF